MDQVKPIPREELDKAHRKMCRRIGATILQCMADTDTGFALIAVRLAKTEKEVRGCMDQFMDGTAQSLCLISDIMTAMGAELTFSVEPRLE